LGLPAGLADANLIQKSTLFLDHGGATKSAILVVNERKVQACHPDGNQHYLHILQARRAVV
jgi:hypothetical protein